MIHAIGFDFDGTLIVSEEEKANIIRDIFKEQFNVRVKSAYKALVGKGFTRAEKIEKLYKKFVNKKPTKTILNKINKEFSKQYESRLKTCPLAACIPILKELKQQTKFMFLLSLENRTQVIRLAKHCGIRPYFNEILGGPKTKIQNLCHVLKKHNIKHEETLYIGDSTGDIIASKKLKIKSIGISQKFNHRKMLKELGANFTVSNLCELKTLKALKKL